MVDENIIKLEVKRYVNVSVIKWIHVSFPVIETI